MIVCANQKKMCVSGAGHAISKLFAGQATKYLLVDGSAEPSHEAHWYGKRQMDVKQKENMFRHIQT